MQLQYHRSAVGRWAGTVLLLLAAIVLLVFWPEPDSAAEAAQRQPRHLASAASFMTVRTGDHVLERIRAQEEIIAMIEAQKAALREPRPIWANDRSSLPVNQREIDAYRVQAEILERDIAVAKIIREELQQIHEQHP